MVCSISYWYPKISTSIEQKVRECTLQVCSLGFYFHHQPSRLTKGQNMFFSRSHFISKVVNITVSGNLWPTITPRSHETVFLFEIVVMIKINGWVGFKPVTFHMAHPQSLRSNWLRHELSCCTEFQMKI